MPTPSRAGGLRPRPPRRGSCSPLGRLLPGPVETPPVKGLYYRRVRKAGALDASPADLRKEILVNVGGRRYLLPWSTLDEFPLSRLSKLRLCRSHEEITQLCDDYDEDSREFFFDRSPSAFGAIVSFLAAGKLVLLREMCALSFREELAYWGVEEARLERCCLRTLLQRREELAELRRQEAALQRRGEARVPAAHGSRWGLCMHRLRDMVENPQSGLPGKVFACLSILFVATTAVSLCVSTMPDLRAEEDKGECSRKCYYIFVVETICVAWFSLEFCLRFVQAQNKCQFFQGPLNIIDILAISPYYVSLAVSEEPPGDGERPSGSSYLEKVGLVLRVLRALRILYVMRLARHSLGLQTLGLTVRRCTREFGLLLLFLAVAVTLFSPLVYVAENESGRVLEFTSIPASYWWAIISMTTVGYGDMVPRSVPGQMVALSSILSGILIMAFPATSIFHTFSHSYLELKKEQEQLQARLRRLQSTPVPSDLELLDASVASDRELLDASVASDRELLDASVASDRELLDASVASDRELLDASVASDRELLDASEAVGHKLTDDVDDRIPGSCASPVVHV
uniref:Potassium voltage-gated channel modifier subfamily G member 4 n=1 Tax=Microcebus murinus TaxID=30608 RepID=A0A8B7EH91_MICMU|nr:potassium voltage-gated channel subfamily G member 4 [Microcebus murinus]XP_012593930.1 potassium voltage-gated channel subfamily G member 4 [Microcebus murinus]XP_012593931.1 potassium voltage-gated channel subfamily G member 4 [Microcebus murinus]XP_012593932.1 potassium voltage-gated channel subfamily G member 4 [Microcebus murinus]